MDSRLSFRPITEDDRPFLLRVYSSTREEELAITGWSPEQKEQFLTMQFDAQHEHYQEHYGDAAFDLILLDGEPVGRLYVDRRQDEHRIIDIALLTEQRGQGVGGGIMQDLLDEAAAAGKVVRIHVEHNNPAKNLYERLGFKQIDDTGVYALMEWNASERAGPRSDV